MVNYLAKKHPEMVLPNVALIPFYGRWDDMYALVGTPAESAMWEVMREQLEADLKAVEEATPEHPADISLLGKWLKSCNSSSKETCARTPHVQEPRVQERSCLPEGPCEAPQGHPDRGSGHVRKALERHRVR